MKQTTIPTCFFPTTVVFVDDSKDYLMNLSLQFASDFNYRLLDSPVEALKHLQQSSQMQGLKQRCMSECAHSLGDPSTNQTINLDIGVIHREVFNAKRFEETSVLFVDYSMPGMNGLELCQALQHLPIKKVLLTGQADEKIGIQAFNDGLINGFIKKSDPDALELMNQTAKDLQRRYFQELSETLIDSLALNATNFLNDPKCITLFNQLCEQHNIKEYYLTDRTGSLLTLTEQGELGWLVVKNSEDLRILAELAQDSDLSAEQLSALTKGEVLPCFGEQDPFQATCSWQQHLYPATKLIAGDTYYYTFVKAPETTLEKQILSYYDFLEQVEAV